MESGYKVPKDIIELLISKYASHQECCDFCDRKHTLNVECWLCKEPKVRCGSNCKNREGVTCVVCKEGMKLKPCKDCTRKYPELVQEIQGRRALRHVNGRLYDSMTCNECLKLEKCPGCGNIKRCAPNCNASIYSRGD